MILRALSVIWTSVAPQMADHLWQSTLFVALAGVLAFALRKNRASVRYWVWMTASLKFLIPFSLLITLGSALGKPRVSTPAQTAVYSAVEDFSQPFAGQEAPAIQPATSSVAPVSRFHLLAPAAVAIWLFGITVVLAWWIKSWVRVAWIARKAAACHEGPEVDALRYLEVSMGIHTPIRLVLSQNWMEPGVFGIFRPVLIWPEGISGHLDGKHIEAVLTHEICHVRRRDNLTAVLHMLVEAIFWFHPLVWWMGRRLEDERERACDESVTMMCKRPGVYAESILRVCKFCSESPLACVSGITGADLKRRVTAIMSGRALLRMTWPKKLLLAAVGLCVITVPVVLGQVKATQRMMLAVVKVAPKPVLSAARAIIAQEQTQSTQLIAKVQGTNGTDVALPSVKAGDKVLRFDVVSIRPTKTDGPNGPGGMKLTGDGIEISNQTLNQMLTNVYPELQFVRGRILGLPDWAKTDKFDIKAKVADQDIAAWTELSHHWGEQAEGRRSQSLLQLYTEQFKLTTHIETREEQMYALVIAKGGPKIKESTSNEPPTLTMIGPGKLKLVGDPVSHIAQMCAQMVGRKVVDETGLTGRYDYSLDWTQSEAAPGGAANGPQSDAEVPPVFAVLPDQLGLKLEARKGPVEYVIVDHAERPASMDGAELSAPRLVAVSQVQENAATVPAFEVISVRPTRPGATSARAGFTPDGYSSEGMPLRAILAMAYRMGNATDEHYTGVPDWAKTQGWDIQAKVGAGDVATWKVLSNLQKEAALQQLLHDRFKLSLHKEPKEFPAYALVLGKSGPKLKDAKPGDSYADGLKKKDGTPEGAGDCHVTKAEIQCQAMSMNVLSQLLSQRMGRTVEDKTGLSGSYDFAFQWAPDVAADLAPDTGGVTSMPDSNGPSIFTALEEQLGLKLDSEKLLLDSLVIDHVERPSEN